MTAFDCRIGCNGIAMLSGSQHLLLQDSFVLELTRDNVLFFIMRDTSKATVHLHGA